MLLISQLLWYHRKTQKEKQREKRAPCWHFDKRIILYSHFGRGTLHKTVTMIVTRYILKGIKKELHRWGIGRLCRRWRSLWIGKKRSKKGKQKTKDRITSLLSYKLYFSISRMIIKFHCFDDQKKNINYDREYYRVE